LEVAKVEEVGKANQAVQQLQNQVTQLQEQLRKQTTEKENEIIKLRNDVKLKDQQIQVLKTKQITDEQIKELNDLKAKNAKLKQQRDEAIAVTYQWDKDYKDLENTWKAAEISIEGYQRDIQNLETENQRLRSQAVTAADRRLKADFDELKKKFDNLTVQKNTAEQRFKESLSNEQKLKELLDQGVISQQALEKIMPVKNPAPTAETLKEIDELKKREQLLVKERDVMKLTIDSLNRQVQQAQQQVQSLTSGQSAAQVKVDQYKTMVNGLLRRVTGDNTVTLTEDEAQNTRTLQNVIQKLEEPFKSQVDTLTRQLAEANAKVTTSAASLKATQDKVKIIKVKF
jgi:chromosome segregation ATPase